jgi:hypothetical protein
VPATFKVVPLFCESTPLFVLIDNAPEPPAAKLMEGRAKPTPELVVVIVRLAPLLATALMEPLKIIVPALLSVMLLMPLVARLMLLLNVALPAPLFDNVPPFRVIAFVLVNVVLLLKPKFKVPTAATLTPVVEPNAPALAKLSMPVLTVVAPL